MNDKPQQQVEHYQPDINEEGAMVEVKDLALMTSSEIDMQITTARRYPRSIKSFLDQMTELATIDEETAKSCIYVLPRDGKMIDGPSARFAELLVSCWGNNRSGGRVVSVDDEFVTGQGFFFDLEKNVAITYEVKRRITNKRGERFNADMIMTTGNAASSIAHRNAALKGIPKALWTGIFEKTKRVIAGDQKTLNSRRIDLIKLFGVLGATKDQVLGLIGVKGLEDVTLEHMVHLGGLYNSIKDGELTVEVAFAPENMRDPDRAVPPRPTKSEFAQAQTATDDKPKPESDKPKADVVKEKVEPEKANEPERQAETQVSTKTHLAQEETVAERRRAEWEEIKRGWVAELDDVSKIRDLADKRDAVDAQLDDPEDKSWWAKACDARREAIMVEIKNAGKKK